MKRTLILLAVATLTAAGCAANNREREEDEVEVAFDQLPPAVRETLSRESGGAPVGKIEREDEKGSAVYEALITKGGKTWEVEVDEGGKVLSREESKGDDRED
jgi:hypothetical protein